MKGLYLSLSLIAVLGLAAHAEAAPMSKETESCLNCHRGLNPGIVTNLEEMKGLIEALKERHK